MTRLDNAPWLSGVADDAYPTVADFKVEAVVDGHDTFGVHMRWVSAAFGMLSDFDWWDHLEAPGSRLDEEDWLRPWTPYDPFVDADMGWALTMWTVDAYVYVHSGSAFDAMNWYRVPRPSFEAEIKRFRSDIGLEP